MNVYVISIILFHQKMEIAKEIRQICEEEEEDWFLTHRMVKIALYDLEQQTESILQQEECVCVGPRSSGDPPCKRWEKGSLTLPDGPKTNHFT